MSYMDSSFVSYHKPDPDRFGERSVQIFAIVFRHKENEQPVGRVVGQFLIAAADEKECRWHLDSYFAGVFGHSTDADNLYYEQWQDCDWSSVVHADPFTYHVKVDVIAEGKLDRRGILFKAYTW